MSMNVMAPMDVRIDASIHMGHSSAPAYTKATDLAQMELPALVSQ